VRILALRAYARLLLLVARHPLVPATLAPIAVELHLVESAWSLLKRGLVGVYHPPHQREVHAYLDEFCFRYTHRHEKPRLMDLVLTSC
jgi:hypothetical protein